MRVGLIVLVGLLFALSAPAADFTSIKDGDWADPETWNNPANPTPVEGTDYPGPNDAVTIGVHFLTVSGTHNCSSLSMIANVNRSGAINFNSQLTITGKLTVAGTVNAASGNSNNRGKRIVVDCADSVLGFQCGTLSLTGAGVASRRAYLEITSGVVQVDSMTFSGSNLHQGVVFGSNASTLRISNSLSSSTAFFSDTPGGTTITKGSIEYSGADASVRAMTYNNLILSGSGSVALPGFPSAVVNGLLKIQNEGNNSHPTVTLSQPISVGDFSQLTGTVNAGAGLIHNVSGDFTAGASAVFNAETSSFRFTSGGSHQIQSSAAFYDLDIEAANTVTLASNLTVLGSLNVSGTLDADAFDIDVFDGGVSVTGELSVPAGRLALHRSPTLGGSGISNVYDLTLATSGAPATTSLEGDVTVENALRIEANRSLSANGEVIRLKGTGTGGNAPLQVNGSLDGISTVVYSPGTASDTEIAALDYNVLVLECAISTQFYLNGTSNIAGVLDILDPDVALTINGVVDLGNTGLLYEGNQNTVGEIRATDLTNAATFIDRGLGITIVPNTSGPIGAISVSRISNTTPPGAGSSIINPVSRYWSISNGGVSVDAQISFGFFGTSELNGNTVGSLVAYRSNNAGTSWSPVLTQQRSNPALVNVNGFGLWALAPIAATTITVETEASGSGVPVSGTVTAGATLKAYTVARDAAGNYGGNPNANWSVNVTSGTFGGEFNNDSNQSTVDFIARTAGSGTLAATVPGVGVGNSGTININPSLPASLSIVAGNGQTVDAGTAVAIAPAVKVQDLYGNLVPGASVTFSPSVGGSVSGNPAISNTAGIATLGSWTLSNTPGPNALDASVNGLSGAITIGFTANGTMAPFVLLIVDDTADTVAGESFSPALTIQIKDPQGNDAMLPGVPVSVALTSGSGVLSGTLTQLTDENGLATFDDLRIEQAGSGKSLTFTSPMMTSAVSATFAIVPAVASQLAILQYPTDAVAGEILGPIVSVQLQDSFGNAVPTSDVQVGVSLSSGLGILQGTATQSTDADGIATFDDLYLDLAGNDKVLSFSADNLPTESGAAFSIVADVPATFAIETEDVYPVAGMGTQLIITLQDAYGNVSTGFSGTKTVKFSGPSIAPNLADIPTVTNNAGTPTQIDTPTALTFTNGVCTAGGLMRLYRAEETFVSLDDTDTDPLGPDSEFLYVQPGTLASFESSFENSQQNDVLFSGTNILTALDTYGNTVTDYDQRTPGSDYAVTILIQQGLAGTLSGNTLQQSDFVNGVASVTDVLKYTGPIGNGLLVAQAGNGISAIASVSIFHGELHHYAFSEIIATPAFAGEDISFSLTAQDISDNTVVSFSGTGANVSISSEKGAGDVLVGVSTADFLDGVLDSHIVKLKKARIEAFLTATGAGKTGTSNTFDVQPSTATTLVFITQPGSGIAGALLGRQPVIQSYDSFENISNVDLVPNVSAATLTLQNSDGTPATATLQGSTSVILDNSGRAVFTNLKVNASGSFKMAVSGLTTGAVSSVFSVVPAVAKVTVSSSALTSLLGSPVTFTGMVTAIAPGEGTPTGSLTFKDGTTTLGTVPLNNGVAALTTSVLAEGSHTITVEYSGDASFASAASEAITQTVSRQPTITTVSPAIGPTTGGTEVQITGSNFQTGATVTFDGVDAQNVVVVSDSSITASTPAHASGSVSVAVRNPSGLTGMRAGGFVYNAPPAVTSGIVFSPSVARVGQAMTASLDISDGDGDVITLAFDWGDGSGPGGASHNYSSAGVFTVIATVSDGVNTITVSQTLTVGLAALPAEHISVLAKKISAKNPSLGRDSVQISGAITVPEGTENLEGALLERFGSITRTYTLTKGKARIGKSSFALSGKMKKGVLTSTTLKFSTRIVDNLAPIISAGGVQPGASGNIVVPYAFEFGGKTYAIELPFVILGKNKTTLGK